MLFRSFAPRYAGYSGKDLQMYLQPKFILRDRSVYGAEALARWKRPDGKILPPGVFIDSLEKIGYITELDFYILWTDAVF